MFEKAPEDVIKFKKRNISSGKAKQFAGKKRNNPFIDSDTEDENAELPKRQRRQTSTTALQTVTRNSKDNSDWLGGF